MKIKKLISVIGEFSIPDDFEVKGISCNSKTVFDGYIFVAIKGTKEDGGTFIEEAIERGAKAVVINSFCCREIGRYNNKIPFIAVRDTRKALAELAAEFYGRPSSKVKVIGITGTNGKTTVTYLIESLLKEAGISSGVIGTINHRFKDRVISSKNTTPGPIELQSMLAGMAEEGVKYCIMEVSSHALEQDRTEDIDFHSAIFTNLTHDHLDYHKTLRNYFNSKAKLFKGISSPSFGIINNDDKFGARFKELTRARIVTYGINNKALVTAKDIKFNIRGTEFRLVCPNGEVELTSSLIGRYNVYNILAAAAWAQAEGIGLSAIKRGIKRFSFVPGRLEKIDNNKDFSVFVDYAHTADALKNVISALKQISKSRIITVFGCGGERDKTKRPKMGRVVTELSDYAIITNDNPRSEEPLEIIGQIKRGIKKANFCVIPVRRDAIAKALSLAKPKDIVLVAGKGHEGYQILKDKTLHFDDREVIKECLKSVN